MPFVKVVKNRAYFKRFQVQYRRRREGKTDYRARRLMVLQDKTKFGSPKYRLVVRITNTDVIAQLIQAKIKGDEVLCAAYSHELPAFGIKQGLTNYASAYATGLLLARRTLTKLKIADKFEGVKDATGAYAQVRTKEDDQGDDESRFPFKAILDVGLSRTTTGARLFGVMKGAVDGGIAIPHKASRFPGYDRKKKELNAKAHRDRIMGKHVADYLKQVVEWNQKNPDDKKTQFSQFVAGNVAPEAIEAMYKKAHAAIRANPLATIQRKSKSAAPSNKPRPTYMTAKTPKAQKVEAARKKVAALRQALGK